MSVNSNLKNFINEALRRGYSESSIRDSLLNHGWNSKEINKAFASIIRDPKYKNQICFFLSDEIMKHLEKRAKKNLFTVSEQIEDILRRSCRVKKTTKEEKLDDFLLKCFSRKK